MKCSTMMSPGLCIVSKVMWPAIHVHAHVWHMYNMCIHVCTYEGMRFIGKSIWDMRQLPVLSRGRLTRCKRRKHPTHTHTLSLSHTHIHTHAHTHTHHTHTHTSKLSRGKLPINQWVPLKGHEPLK